MSETYVVRFNIEGGKYVDIHLNAEKFNEMSEFCDQVFPDKEWETKLVKNT
ncbi:protein of unknown function [Nitrosotalea devaniterrae]|uniref:Uncharacterized protein n=1 Tax=Nitrosotalea devaniterrae TaxID=1078905 RepID=A0A128A1Y6_9ARCH|nr:protein of unknown function [Candidatus Nitrosotalea devanaterra]